MMMMLMMLIYTQVYTEMLCRGSVYVSSFSAVELVDQLRAELRQNANSAINHLTRLHLLLHTGPTDRYVLPTAVTLVARSLSLSLSLSLCLSLYDSTSTGRLFVCLSNVIKVIVNE